MRLPSGLFASLAFVVGAALPGNAQSADASLAALQKIFAATTVDPAAFSANFLANVPAPAIAAVVNDYRTRLGTLSTIAKVGTDYALTFERGGLLARIALDPDGKIGALKFHDETSPTTRAALVRFLSSPTPAADAFSDAFLKQIPLAQIAAVLAEISAREGKFLRLDLRNGAYVAVFEHAENHVLASLDAAGKFTLLLVEPGVARSTRT